MSEDIWTPPGMPVFKPGDRVMVRINMECKYCLDPDYKADYERALADDGRIGIVYSVGHADCPCRYDSEPADNDHMGHTIWIGWDERRSYDDVPIPLVVGLDSHFAPSELIHMEDDV